MGVRSIGQALEAPARPLPRPSPWSELGITLEFLALIGDPIYRGIGVRHGAGEPVLVIPGLLAGDATLRPLRGWLHRLGYTALESGIAAHLECPDRTVRRLVGVVERAATAAGRKVAVIGHSKGGLVAAALGQTAPDLVSHVVTLGSPIADPFDVAPLTAAAIATVRGINRLGHPEAPLCYSVECSCPTVGLLRGGGRRPAVATTSIYSLNDAVVNWRACLGHGVHRRAVNSTHIGMVVNRDVYQVLADLLYRNRRR